MVNGNQQQRRFGARQVLARPTERKFGVSAKLPSPEQRRFGSPTPSAKRGQPRTIPRTEEQLSMAREEARQSIISSNLQVIDEREATIRNELERLRQLPTDEQTQSVDDQIDRLDGELFALDKARDLARQGVSETQISQFLLQSAEAKIFRREFQPLGTIQPSKTIESQAEEDLGTQAREQGLQPVTDNTGKIVGFEDFTSGGQSISRAEGLKRLKIREAEPVIIEKVKEQVTLEPTIDKQLDTTKQQEDLFLEVKSNELSLLGAFKEIITTPFILGGRGFKEEGVVGGLAGLFTGAGLSADILARVERGSFFGRSPTGLVFLTEGQVQDLKEADIGTPFVSIEAVRAFESGLTRTELVLRTREEIGKKAEDNLTREIFLTQGGLRGDVLAERISAELSPSFQQRIIDGEITQTEAEQEFQTRFKTRSEQVIEGVQKLEDEATGRKVKVRIGDVEFGEISLGGKTSPAIIRDRPRELGLFIKKAPELAVLGLGGASAVLGLGAIKFGGGVLTDQEEEILSGATLIGFGGLGKIKNIERQIVAEELKQLSKVDFKILELRIPEEGAEVSLIRGARKFRGLEQDLELSGIFVKKGKKFIFKGTKGQVTTGGELSFNILGGAETTKIASIQEFDLALAGRGFAIDPKRAISVSESAFIPKFESSLLFQGKLVARRRGLDLITGRIIKKDDPTNLAELIKTTERSQRGIIKQQNLGLSQKIRENLFATRGGKITRGRLDIETRGISPQFTAEISGKFETTGITAKISRADLNKFFKTELQSALTPRPSPQLTKIAIGRATAESSIIQELAQSVESATIGTAIKRGLSTFVLPPASQEFNVLAGLSSVARNIPKPTAKVVLPTLPKIEVLPVSAQKEITRISTITKQKQPSISKQRTQLKNVQRNLTELLNLQINRQSSQLRERQGQLLRQSQLQKQATEGLSAISIPTRLDLDIPLGLRPLLGFPFKLPGIGGKPKKPKRTEQQGFNVLVKPIKLKGEKQKPFVKANTKPLRKLDAELLRDFTIDNSLGRTGRIKPVRGKPQRLPIRLNKPNPNKFRNFRQRKGKRIIDPFLSIEKNPFLLDTFSERQRISVIRKVSGLRKRQRTAFAKIKKAKTPIKRKSVKGGSRKKK